MTPEGWLPILLGGCFAFAEAILGVGIVMPGEVLITGLTTSIDGTQMAPFFMFVVLGAVAGDHLNYGLGRTLGPRLSQSRIVARIGIKHWDRGVDLIRRHGATALIISRLIPVVRTLMPAIAGVSHLPYRKFAAASLVGSCLWATVWITAGGAVAALISNPSLLLAGVAPLALAVVATSGHHRRHRGIGSEPPAGRFARNVASVRRRRRLHPESAATPTSLASTAVADEYRPSLPTATLMPIPRDGRPADESQRAKTMS